VNHSLLTADRATHLKIVIIALVAAIAVVAVGVTARVNEAGTATARIQDAPVVKAGKPATYTRSDDSAIR
jgi:hypothetical protein